MYEAAAAAKEAFSNWSRTRSEERAAILDRAADLVQRDFLAHAEVARAETGADRLHRPGERVAASPASGGTRKVRWSPSRRPSRRRSTRPGRWAGPGCSGRWPCAGR
ncbi:hypothetical protein SMICM304S_05819 [Streptomyces microflavus]